MLKRKSVTSTRLLWPVFYYSANDHYLYTPPHLFYAPPPFFPPVERFWDCSAHLANHSHLRSYFCSALMCPHGYSINKMATSEAIRCDRVWSNVYVGPMWYEFLFKGTQTLRVVREFIIITLTKRLLYKICRIRLNLGRRSPSSDRKRNHG